MIVKRFGRATVEGTPVDDNEGELLPQPAVDDIELVRVLHALGDPVRLWLLKVYESGEPIGCAPDVLGLDHLHKSTVSHHLKVMREAGLTSTQAVGRNRNVRLRRADLDARFPGLLDALFKSAPDRPS
jgi:DNA-binding transcriptional ArsR family regulator